MNICKICGNKLSLAPLIQYKNMPSVAQHLPDATTVQDDRGVDLDIYECSGCGLVQLTTEPVSYYKEVIRAVAYSPSMKEFRQKQFAEFVKTYNLADKKVIEIGAGRGEYLELMKEAGADAHGLEYGEESVKAAQEKGLRVTQGFIDSQQYQIPGGPFDAFFIISFFEHLPRPGEVLLGISNNLSEGAVGMVEVPNFDMMIRENLFSEFMRDHLFYFTRNTLALALEMNGFEILRINEVWHNYILSAEVKKRKKTDLSSFTAHREKIQSELDAFITKHKTVAVWGAGHQAFAIMAMAGLGGKIKYIIDSAPFKQGKLSPASHIPIVAPDMLMSEPVNSVIIMAGSYSDEIKKIIKKQYSSHIAVAVLRDFGLEID